MMHIRFFASEAGAREAFAAMQADLGAIHLRIPFRSEPDLDDAKMSGSSEELKAFLDKYP